MAPGTTLSGETVTVIAGRNLNLRGGNLVSTEGTTLIAGRDINLLAATSSGEERHFRSEKKSGLMGSGGVCGYRCWRRPRTGRRWTDRS